MAVARHPVARTAPPAPAIISASRARGGERDGGRGGECRTIAFRWPARLPPEANVQFDDSTGRLTKEDIAAFPGPISEISEIEPEGPGRRYRVAVDHPGKQFWWEALRIHQSPFEHSALVRPIFGNVGEYRAICVALLYGLSIVGRYRPSIWRRVQEGDLDHVRVLIEAFLAVTERVLPEQFLEKITGQRVFAKQPGSFY